MSFVETISETEASGVVKEIYDSEMMESGYIWNATKLFCLRPEVFKAWEELIKTISQNMVFRRYELITLTAARTLGSTYCMLAHSDKFLNSGEVDEAQLVAIAKDYHHAQLTPEEVAIMEFAEKVVMKSGSITQEDVNHLRSFGISDTEIMDITLAAAVRCFFSKTLDALNAEPDAKYMKFDAELLHALIVGRPYGAEEKISQTAY